MCGIVARLGSGQAGRSVLRALRALEYRGYDSTGVGALRADGSVEVRRAVGPLARLTDSLDDADAVLADDVRVAIGHTRWATHGEVSVRNAHPFVDCGGGVAVVHNGIIENAAELRVELGMSGHAFASDVDSEVVAHLVEQALGAGHDPIDAVAKAVARLEGSWALGVLIAPGRLVIARNGSPLVVRGNGGNVIVASDPAATMDVPGMLRALEDGDIVEIGAPPHGEAPHGELSHGEPRWRWMRGDGGHEPREPIAESTIASLREFAASAGSPGREDRMGGEIAEQPAALERVISRLAPQVASGALWRDLAVAMPSSVRFLACGSSYHASKAVARTLSAVAGLPADVVIASEFEPSLVAPAQLTVAISQSGETADLLRALDRVEGPVIGITNSPWSSLARRSDAVLDCVAGPEFGVAATKSFSSQIVLGVLLSLAIAQRAGRHEEVAALLDVLRAEPERIRVAEEAARAQLPSIAAAHADAPGWLFLGRGAALPYAAEGALKLEEISYRWAQSYPAGELKHGPLALVEDGTPVVLVHSGDRPALATSAAEVAARGARLIHVDVDGAAVSSSSAPSRSVLLDEAPPWGPLAALPALQHLARSLAQSLGRDVDRPRNLAKSVTVV